MTARRFLIATVAVAWLFPATTAAAIALHVALEHEGGHGHEATPHVAELPAAVEPGHFHSADGLPHQHSAVAVPAEVAVRRAPGSLSDSTVASGAAWAPWVGVGPEEAAARPPARPPRASGPPLLARLSTLRI